MRLLVLMTSVALVAGNPAQQRIIGGSVTTIDQYPTIVSMLTTFDGNFFYQSCGGTIINNRSILTAAHCTTTTADRWRARVGSTFANSGGVVYSIIAIINHPQYGTIPFDFDISIVRTASAITFNNVVQAASFAGGSYNLPDNSVVWAAGWGVTETGFTSEQLRHVQVWTINQTICRQRYSSILTDNMLCSGWLDVGGRDQCSQDSGGPLYHNGVVVGVCSFGNGCASPHYPGVNARVSRFISWIQANA